MKSICIQPRTTKEKKDFFLQELNKLQTKFVEGCTWIKGSYMRSTAGNNFDIEAFEKLQEMLEKFLEEHAERKEQNNKRPLKLWVRSKRKNTNQKIKRLKSKLKFLLKTNQKTINDAKKLIRRLRTLSLSLHRTKNKKESSWETVGAKDESDWETLEILDKSNSSIAVLRSENLRSSQKTFNKGVQIESPLSQIEIQPYYTIEDKLDLTIREINNHKDQDNIGNNWTHLAIKNSKNYMVGTNKKGIKVISDGKQIFRGQLPFDDRFHDYISLMDMVYIEHLNCYILDYNGALWRKDVDEKPPYFYYQIDLGRRIGASFLYSDMHDRLIVAEDAHHISVINLEEKDIEIKSFQRIDSDIQDFKLFGESQQRVVALTEFGHIRLFEVNFLEKSIEMVCDFCFKLNPYKEERGQSIAVCPKGDYFPVELRAEPEEPNICSRVMVIKNFGNFLSFGAFIDHHEKIPGKMAVECLGYLEDHIAWIGLSRTNEEGGVGRIQLYGYDIIENEVRELEDKRLKHREIDPVKLHRVAKNLYYTGDNGKVFMIKYRL